MKIEGLARDELQLAMPVWKPGSYTVRPFARAVQNLAATAENGESLTVSQPESGSWVVSTAGHETIAVEYDLRLRGHAIGPRKRKETADGVLRYHDAFLFEGPATWLYLPGRLDVPYTITFDLPEDCPSRRYRRAARSCPAYLRR